MDKRDLVERLHGNAQGIDLGADGMGWSQDPGLLREAAAEIERIRTENAALKREAHTWWEAARDATKAETERCALVAALHNQYPVTTDYDRGYAKARADAAAAIRVGPNFAVEGLNMAAGSSRPARL